MDKEENSKACYLEMPPGLNGVRYKQDFVRAPMSLHPPKENAAKEKFGGHSAMGMCMGK